MNRLVANRDRLTRTFVDLAQIDSPSLEEAAIAKVVRAELEGLGWDVTDDRTGPQVGNLLARRPGHTGSPPRGPVLFARGRPFRTGCHRLTSPPG